jgi:hypothetical protein
VHTCPSKRARLGVRERVVEDEHNMVGGVVTHADGKDEEAPEALEALEALQARHALEGSKALQEYNRIPEALEALQASASVGDQVEVLWGDGELYWGKVRSISNDNKLNLVYDDGSHEPGILRDQIQRIYGRRAPGVGDAPNITTEAHVEDPMPPS